MVQELQIKLELGARSLFFILVIKRARFLFQTQTELIMFYARAVVHVIGQVNSVLFLEFRKPYSKSHTYIYRGKYK